MAQPFNELGSSRSASGLVSPQHRIRSRTHSFSSDHPSTVGYGSMSPPLSVSPEAAFIAASAASQIVTNDHDSHANTWYDEHSIEPPTDSALVSPAALQLVNNFLDQLLFSFLSLSHSTSLAALRPAVTEVLKPKLAKDAINQADEELREYLGGGDDDDMLQSRRSASAKDWDIELVWKRTRLRCMVYSSLGDMEEEDEDLYMEQEHLEAANDSASDTVSAAVAIFLTSILEFMGEQALISAGQAAYHRMRFIYEKDHKASTSPRPAPVADRITVEEVDMERVAFDRTIGRLWRSWKKRIRSPNTDVHPNLPGPFSDDYGRLSHRRQFSQSASESAYASKRTSESTEARTSSELEERSRQLAETTEAKEMENKILNAQQLQIPQPAVSPQATTTTAYLNDEEWLSAAIAVPLPISDRDVAEILIPGLTCYDDEGEDGDTEEISSRTTKKARKGRAKDRRPQSLVIPPRTLITGLPTPDTSEPRTPELPSRKRANSLPTPSTSPYSTPQAKRIKATGGRDSCSVPEEVDDKVDKKTADETTSGATPVQSPGDQNRARMAPPPLTTVIGAAITTTSPRAIPMAAVVTEKRPSPEAEADGEIEEFEEAQIMTSARVSISGRSNSPTTSEQGTGRRLSISPVLAPGSPSIHSPRVIEVIGPRSPISRSRGSSIDAQDPVAVSRGNISRASSISTPPIAEESHISDVASVLKTSYMGIKAPLVYKSESISETEEDYVAHKETKAEAGPAAATELPLRPAENAQTTQAVPVSLSVAHPEVYTTPISSPLHPPPPQMSDAAPTKVTILAPSVASGSFFIDDVQEELAQATRQEVKPASSPLIAVPERSAKRDAGRIPASTSREQEPELWTAAKAGAQARSQTTQTEVQAKLQALAKAQMQVQPQARPQPQPLAQPQAAPQSHTAASSTSSLGSKLKPVRTSEENTLIRPEDVARNFEQLIQSDETIQYTLTPENMRAFDSSRTRTSNEGGSVLPKSRKSEDTRQGDRSRSSSVATNKQPEIKRSTSVSRGNSTEARPTETTPNGRLNGPVPRMPHNLAGSVSSASLRSRVGGPQARDARVPRESLADFAEFIRETGPAGDNGTAMTRRRAQGGAVGAPIMNAARNASSPATFSKGGLSRKLSTAGSSRSRYQAREATVTYKDDNSDLIDFIRRGPPETVANPRIPQTVAPFRTTMDTDQMTGGSGGRAVDATFSNMRFSASTNVTESSVGSSAGLIRNKAAPAVGTGTDNVGASSVHTGSEADMMPKRKTRRVKDPYAIDLSDEEDEEFYASLGRGPKPPAKEESLLDFLNSVPPPMETAPRPFDIAQSRAPKPAPRKKASASSLMSRFVRSSHGSSSGGRGLFSSSGADSRPDARSVSSRAGSMTSRGHVPIQVQVPPMPPPPPVSKYGPTPSAPSNAQGTRSTGSGSGRQGPVVVPPPVMGQGNRNGNSNGAGRQGPVVVPPPVMPPPESSAGRVPRKKFEPREAQSVSSRATQDLAEFFRNSGPAQPFRG